MTAIIAIFIVATLVALRVTRGPGRPWFAIADSHPCRTPAGPGAEAALTPGGNGAAIPRG